MKKKIIVFILVALCLTSCGTQDKRSLQDLQDDRKVLELAVFASNSKVSKQVTLFNETNQEYRIEIINYERTTETEGDGIAKLQRDIISGNGPDIIDYGGQYSAGDVVGEYTEDLYPYLKKEQEQKKEDFFMNIIDSYSYDGGLYSLPVSFTLFTMAGSNDSLGQQKSWNIEEMIHWYQNQEKGVLLYPGQCKQGVIGFILNGNMDCYMNWNKGTCNFEDEDFKKILSFANTFQQDLFIPLDYSTKASFWKKEVLLFPQIRGNVYNDCDAENLLNNTDINYIGYPVEEGSGTFIKPGDVVLAISIGSKEKEASWEFISQFLDDSYQSSLEFSYPINRNILEEELKNAMIPEYETDENGNKQLIAKYQVRVAGEDPIDIYSITEVQADNVLNMIESATRCTTTDFTAYNMIDEEASSYFSGEKTLEEVCNIIQNRISTYMSEKVK